MRMYEYIIENNKRVEDNIVLYNNSSFTTEDLLNMISTVLVDNSDYLQDFTETDLLLEVVFLLCEKYNFTNRTWIEYKHRANIKCSSLKELKKDIAEQLYEF